MAKIKELPCVLCSLLERPQEAPTEVHHIREGQGLAQRANDYLTVPLCVECHRGPNGIHGDRTYLRILKVTELDLLAETIKEMDKKRGLIGP